VARILSKIIVAMLALWAAFIVISEIAGVTVFFPFNFVETVEIPYHRMQAVRLSVFLTFIYFGVLYIFMQSEKLYPIQFLDIYIKSITICSLFVFYSQNVSFREYYFVFFFFVVSVILHFASRKKIRNYFN
tara:strand:- start:607 stop:999 length:393 start_codon:yes stop_codon:yes gene_type:complete